MRKYIKRITNMKKFINILLGLCIIGLAYIFYGSIMGPIKFAKEKSIRDNAVISRLLDIKDAQTEYHNQHGGMYTASFDTLINFVKTGKVPIIKKTGELSDDQMEADWTELKVLSLYQDAKAAEAAAKTLTGSRAARKAQEAKDMWKEAADAGFLTLNDDGTVKEFIFSRDTVWIDVMDSLYHGKINPDSLRFIPFGNGKQFEMETSCDTTKSGSFQYSFSAQTLFKNYLDGLDAQEVFNLIDDRQKRGLYEGMRVDNNSGNWE